MYTEIEAHKPIELEKIITDPAETLVMVHHSLPLTPLLLLTASHSPVLQLPISLLSQAAQLATHPGVMPRANPAAEPEEMPGPIQRPATAASAQPC